MTELHWIPATYKINEPSSWILDYHNWNNSVKKKKEVSDKVKTRIFNSLRPVASSTKEVNSRLAKRPLVFNEHLANCRLTSFVKLKGATGDAHASVNWVGIGQGNCLSPVDPDPSQVVRYLNIWNIFKWLQQHCCPLFRTQWVNRCWNRNIPWEIEN